LRRWLEQPLLQLEAITARLDAVAELAADTIRRQQLRQALRPIPYMVRDCAFLKDWKLSVSNEHSADLCVVWVCIKQSSMAWVNASKSA